MAPGVPWFERRFRFDLPAGAFPVAIERLRGTPARLEERAGAAPADVLTRRVDDRWSIQENVGHLLDLEPLWRGRVDDFMEGREILRAADLTNRRTHEANHNGASIDALLEAFRDARRRLVTALEPLSEADFARTALHPRLQQPMRLIDHCLFVAEHDDHHLARVTALLRLRPA